MPQAAEYGIGDIQEFLEGTLGLQGEVRGSDHRAEYSIFCPNPNHNDTHPSTDINLVTGYWNCFACGIGGDILELAMKVTGKSRAQMLEVMKPNSEDAIKVKISKRLQHLNDTYFGKKDKPVQVPPSKRYDPGPHTYMRSRGFRQETLRKWGVRYVHREELEGKEGNFIIQHSVAIPIRDRHGNLLAWCYRATPDSPAWQQQNVRYLYTPGIDINELWFGVQFYYRAPEVVIVEGAIDCMWLDQAGIPALGLLGGSMGDAKILELQRYRRVFLMGDRDDAGARWVERVGRLIGHRMPVHVCLYPSYTSAGDPEKVLPVDLEIMVAKALPWAVYRSRL